MKTKVYLCAFASPDLDLSVDRFIEQAQDLNFYEKIKVYRTQDLSKELIERISNLMSQKGSYLFGYEVWKQKIVLDYLNLTSDYIFINDLH